MFQKLFGAIPLNFMIDLIELDSNILYAGQSYMQVNQKEADYSSSEYDLLQKKRIDTSKVDTTYTAALIRRKT